MYQEVPIRELFCLSKNKAEKFIVAQFNNKSKVINVKSRQYEKILQGRLV